MKKTIFVDTREVNSVPILEPYFDIQRFCLKVGDLYYASGSRKYLIEIKIDNDILDFRRLEDELTRMNYIEYKDILKHAIYFTRYGQESEILHNYKIFVNFCTKAGVFPHHVYGPKRFIELLKHIFNGHYDDVLQQHYNETKKADILTRMIRCFPGIIETKAIDLTIPVRNFLWRGNRNLEPIIDIIGRKKDGSPTAIAEKFCLFLSEGIEP